MDFKIISEITNVETFARGVGVRIRDYLNRQHAGSRRLHWRHRKGFAEVEYNNGEIWLAEVHWFEVHWFEVHGIGRRDESVKHQIRGLA